jgi:DNA polymerase elongation subunit (family B)
MKFCYIFIVKKMQELILFPYDWGIENSDYLRIIAWCLDKDCRTYCIRILNFTYSLYTKETNDYGQTSQSKINDFKQEMIKVETVHNHRTLYFHQSSNQTFHILKTISKQKFENLIKDLKKQRRPIFEHNIDPILKFITKRNLKYSSWLVFKNPKVPREKISRADFEYVVEWDQCDLYPGRFEIEPKILAFDIECYSEEINTMPKPFFASNKILMISCTILEKGSQKRKLVITHVPIEKIDSCEIISVKDEEELLEEFQNVIIREKPQIITGFNIFGFDYRYINIRMNKHLKPWKNIGLLINDTVEVKEIFWESSAYGEQRMTYPKISGIINIDLMRIISREYKLPTYSLNTVSKTFLGRTKLDVEHSFIFKTYHDFCHSKDKKPFIKHFTKITQYCIEDSNLVIDIFRTLNLWITLTEMSSIFYTAITDLYTRGQQIRCFNQLYKKCKERNVVIDKRQEASTAYEGADVIEPKQGLHEFVICIDFKSLYPSIIILKNICYTTFTPKLPHGSNIEDYNVVSWTSKEGEHYEYYFYNKEKGLIPEILENLIKRRNEVKKQMAGKSGIEYVILDKQQLALKISSNAFFGFLGTKDKGYLPLMPASMSITAVGRENIRKCKQKIEDTYKANIIYGDTDSLFFNIPGVKSIPETFEIGSRITKEINSQLEKPLEVEFEKACKMLCLMKKHYSFWYYDPKTKDYKYNIRIEGLGERSEDKQKIEEYAKKLGIGVHNVKVNGSLITIKKEPALEHKGNVLSRRDKSGFLKQIYEKVLKAILVESKTIQEVYDIIQEHMMRLLTFNYEIEELCIIKGVKTNYENTGMFKILTDRLKAGGMMIYEGMRLETVILKPDSCEFKTKIGERTFTKEEVCGMEEPKKLIDVKQYILSLEKPVEKELYQIGFKKVINELNKKKYERICKEIENEFPNVKGARELLKRQPDEEWLRDVYEYTKVKKLKAKIRTLMKDIMFTVETPVKNMLKIIEYKESLHNELKENFDQIKKRMKRVTKGSKD